MVKKEGTFNRILGEESCTYLVQTMLKLTRKKWSEESNNKLAISVETYRENFNAIFRYVEFFPISRIFFRKKSFSNKSFTDFTSNFDLGWMYHCCHEAKIRTKLTNEHERYKNSEY